MNLFDIFRKPKKEFDTIQIIGEKVEESIDICKNFDKDKIINLSDKKLDISVTNEQRKEVDSFITKFYKVEYKDENKSKEGNSYKENPSLVDNFLENDEELGPVKYEGSSSNTYISVNFNDPLWENKVFIRYPDGSTIRATFKGPVNICKIKRNL